MNVHGIIYKAINKINNKIYIGQTIRTLEDRKKEHAHPKKDKIYLFQRAIMKYGFENFEWITIDYAFSQEELNIKEICWIQIYDSSNINKGYNLTKGGEFGKLTGEAELKRCENSRKWQIENIGKKVINLGTHKVYLTIREASECEGVTATAISLCCNGTNQTAGKYMYAFYDEYSNNKDYYDNLKWENKYNTTKVINLSTNKIYNLMTEAEKETNTPYQSISKCCRREQKSANNYFWAYYDEYNNNEEYREYFNKLIKEYNTSKNKKVRNIDTNMSFESLTEASLYYGVSNSAISRACQGKVKTSCGCRWEFIA